MRAIATSRKGGTTVSLTEFFEYLITHDQTADLGSDLVQTYYERVEVVVGAAPGAVERTA